MGITVRYASTRREVWSFYMWLWKRRLWKMHLVIFASVVVSGSFATWGRLPNDAREAFGLLLAALVPIALLALFPMLMFKPQTRSLTVNRDGIETSIGRHHKALAWSEIADVRDRGDALVVQGRNHNAFIVPARAFDGIEKRMAFAQFVRAHAQTD